MHWETKESLLEHLRDARRTAVLSNAVTALVVSHYVWGLGWGWSAGVFVLVVAVYSPWANV